MRIVIVGIDSMIGSAVAKRLRESHEVIGTTRRFHVGRYTFLDLSLPIDVDNLPPGSAVLFCAAQTSHADCEANPILSNRVNVLNTMTICHEYISRGARLVFLSSSSVFDGQEPNRKLQDQLSPVSLYGQQKAMVETALFNEYQTSLVCVIRLGRSIPSNFSVFSSWHKSLKDNLRISPYANLNFAPVSLDFAANLIARIVQTDCTGIFQITAADTISYADAAFALCAQWGLDVSLVRPLDAFASVLPAGAIFPYATLDGSRVRKTFGVEMPPATDALKTVMP